MDLRVDDHAAPVTELARLLDLHELLFGRPTETRPLSEDEIRWLQTHLAARGLRHCDVTGRWDDTTERGLEALYGIENLEERWVGGGQVDPVAWTHLRRTVEQ